MKTKFLFLIIISSFISQGQTLKDLSRNIDVFNPNGGLMYNNKYDTEKNIKGSFMLFPIWDGNFILQSLKEEKFSLNNLNYNLKTKKLQSLLGKDSIFELKINNIDFLIASNVKYKVINEELYKELFMGNKVKLYKHFTVKLHDAFINPMTKSVDEPAYYEQMSDYFYFLNESFISIKLNKKAILLALKDNENAIKTFVSKNNLFYNEEKDVIKIFEYYNTL